MACYRAVIAREKISLLCRRQAPQPEALCRACGLCCNGALFADVKLRDTDDSTALAAGVLTLKASPLCDDSRQQTSSDLVRLKKLPQPCAAYCGKLCRIYPHRPAYCREFECALLLAAREGRINMAAARRTIDRALKQLDEVLKLLRQLGDTNEQAPLKRRCARIARRLAATGAEARTAALYARLTLRHHRLQLTLASYFYPGRAS